MEKTELVLNKARPAIQITGNPTLLQRKAWNVLLANAYNELPNMEIHQMQLSKLADGMAYESKNIDYFKGLLGGLSECSVEWNVMSQDGKFEWGKAALLAEVKIKDGVCSYAYSPTMRQYLHNPAIYAKLNLAIQNRFSSKHSLTLWELCTDYKKVGSTGWIDLDKFKTLLGIGLNIYKQFFKFNAQVIKPAIEEINEKQTDFLVTVEFERFKRRVSKVRLLIQEKEVATETLAGQDEKKPVANRKKADPVCKICSGTGWEFLSSNVTQYCKCTFA